MATPVLSLRHLGGFLLLRRLCGVEAARCLPAWETCAARTAAKMGIRRKIVLRGTTRLEPTADAVEGWCATVAATAVDNTNFQRECTPGYYNNEGQPKGGSGFAGAYPAGPAKFNQLLEDWRDTGELPGMELDGVELGAAAAHQ